MIVLDASAAVLALLRDGDARRRLGVERVVVPHLIDAEVTSALRSQVLKHQVEERTAAVALDRWSKLGLHRYGMVGLLARVWELRANLSAYDAVYVALAEAVDGELVTADARLAGAPGPTCPIVVVRD